MDSLVQDRIYKKVAVIDYQGACVDDKSHYSASAAFVSVSSTKMTSLDAKKLRHQIP